MNKKQVTTACLCILFIGISIAGYLLIRFGSFTIKLGGTDSSASGSSSYVWTLRFKNNTLVSATEHSNTGIVGFTGSADCNFQNGTWVDQTTGKDCPNNGTGLFDIPLDRASIQQKIKSGEFIKGDPTNCGANRAGAHVCYQISYL